MRDVVLMARQEDKARLRKRSRVSSRVAELHEQGGIPLTSRVKNASAYVLRFLPTSAEQTRSGSPNLC